jgi:hypothetical protein
MSNSLLIAQLILDYSTSLSQLAALQAKARAENREPTDEELDKLGEGDDVKRARFQAAIDDARSRRISGSQRPPDM